MFYQSAHCQSCWLQSIVYLIRADTLGCQATKIYVNSVNSKQQNVNKEKAWGKKRRFITFMSVDRNMLLLKQQNADTSIKCSTFISLVKSKKCTTVHRLILGRRKVCIQKRGKGEWVRTNHQPNTGEVWQLGLSGMKQSLVSSSQTIFFFFFFYS